MNLDPLKSEPQDDFADILKLADNYIPKESENNDASWKAFQAKLESNNKQKVSSNLTVTYRRIMSYAAVIALLILAGYMYFQPQKQTPINTVVENTLMGEIREIKLPDGSTVILSPNSELSYEISESARKINLNGHARFEVARNENAPFTINASNTLVTVLGTGFDVNAYPNSDVKVFVNHGKVKVETETQEIILTQNQSVVAQKNELLTWDYKNNPLNIANGNLNFENARLDFVMETLNHFCGIQLQIDPSNQNAQFSGTLNTKQTAEEVATILSAALQIQVTPLK